MNETARKEESEQIEVLNFYRIGKRLPPNAVYVGRANKRFNLPQSMFANPFPMIDSSDKERSRVIEEYRHWLWEEMAANKISKSDLLSLRGKKLVCYCSPKPCHGNIIKEAVELLLTNESEFNKRINLHKHSIKVKKPTMYCS